MSLILLWLLVPEKLYAEARESRISSKEIAQYRANFLADDDFLTKFKRLNELEQQALQLVDDEPLKLGSLGSAILDIYPASHTGHYILREFYAHLDTVEAHANHSSMLEQLQSQMKAQGDGSSSSPYPIMTVYDAQTYARTRQESPVGAIYQSNRDLPLGYLMVSRPTQGALVQTSFTLEHLLGAFSHNGAQSSDDAIRSAPPAATAEFEYANNPWVLIRLFAADSDSAAQSAIGAYLATMQKYDQAIGWLRVASRSGNVLANRLLARIYFAKADEAETSAEEAEFKDLALENYMHAIALGSADAMYTLANLYINDYYGADNKTAGLPLLEQAADLDHTEALIYLGHLYDTGNEVPQDRDKADAYFARAAANDAPQAILNYGRFLTARKTLSASPSIVAALQRLAEDNQPEAMVVLGNLHARGIGTKASNRKALRWYKRAVREAPENPDIVNEVAWTLTVSDIEGLQRNRYAKRIMDTMMQTDESQQRPEYLDTWAATHAATGDFAQAVKLQQQAISVAREQQRSDVMDILEKHLEKFENGTTITESAP
ncbi:MAG: hypothetical protein AAF993_16370 [Pseudomonadota bacterium]